MGELSLSTGFGGLREGGVNVIIIVVAGMLEDGLKVGRERHRVGKGVEVREEGEREELGEERTKGATYKVSHQQEGNPEP